MAYTSLEGYTGVVKDDWVAIYKDGSWIADISRQKFETPESLKEIVDEFSELFKKISDVVNEKETGDPE